MPSLRALLAVAAVLALLVAVSVAITEWQRATEAEEEAERLADELDALRAEVARLESEVEAAARDPEPPGDPPADDDPLAGLFDTSGPLGEMLLDPPGADCLAAADGGIGQMFGGGGAADLPEDPRQLVEEVADDVAEMRELDWQREVEVDFLTGDELGDRLTALLDEDVDPATLEAEQRMLAALGAVDDDLDLEAVQRDMLEDQVAGYYVPETGELVVRVPDDGRIRPIDAVTLAHELEHALADQALGLPETALDADDGDADATLGAVALIEGDATLLMGLWQAEHLSLADQLDGLLDGDLDLAQLSMASVPHYLQREMLFPYTTGLDYVCEVYLEGGWAAVDERYADPPATSVEVLHPEREGESPADPPPLTGPEGGQELISTTFGAAPLQWLLQAPGDDPGRALDDPAGRASAWGGGMVTAWDLGGETAVGLALVDRGEGQPLCDTMIEWHAAATGDRPEAADGPTTVFRGDGDAASVRCEGDEVRYGRAGWLGAVLRITSGS